MLVRCVCPAGGHALTLSHTRLLPDAIDDIASNEWKCGRIQEGNADQIQQNLREIGTESEERRAGKQSRAG
jgi:hypothetical protein